MLAGWYENFGEKKHWIEEQKHMIGNKWIFNIKLLPEGSARHNLLTKWFWWTILMIWNNVDGCRIDEAKMPLYCSVTQTYSFECALCEQKLWNMAVWLQLHATPIILLNCEWPSNRNANISKRRICNLSIEIQMNLTEIESKFMDKRLICNYEQ